MESSQQQNQQSGREVTLYDPYTQNSTKPIPPTLLGLMRDDNIGFLILENLFEDEEIVLQYRANFFDHNGAPLSTIITALSQPGLFPFTVVRNARLTTYTPSWMTIIMNMQIGSNCSPPRTLHLMPEYNLLLLDRFCKFSSRKVDTLVSPTSNFSNIRLACRDMYTRAWEYVRARGSTGQVLSLAPFDLHIPNNNASDDGVWHMKIDAANSMHTLIFGPSFNTRVDYSDMIQRLPKLEFIIPSSIHTLVNRNSESFNPTTLWCGLVCRSIVAHGFVQELIDRLLPRGPDIMQTLPGQNVILVRHVSFAVIDDAQKTCLSLIIGFRLCARLEPPNKPFVIFAGLELMKRPVQRDTYALSALRAIVRRYVAMRNQGINEFDSVRTTMHPDVAPAFPTNNEARTIWVNWNVALLAPRPNWTLGRWGRRIFNSENTIFASCLSFLLGY